MKEFSWYVGIDVSKEWLDIAIISSDGELGTTSQIDNDIKSIRKHITGLNIDIDKTLFCLENTGKYGNAFLEVTCLMQLNTWVEHPLQIKRSQGMTRGKTDKYDAIRIAQYAYRFKDKAVFWKPEEKIITQLRELQGKRDMLVKSQKQLRQITEGKLDKIVSQPIKALKEAIIKIENIMLELIKTDPKLFKQFTLLQSVPGIGKIVAISLLITTKGFTNLTNPRKLACYIGVAPFPYQSGSSINYKNRISKLGDQRLKALINLSAWNAIRSVPYLKAYFLRKTEEGKHKLKVINAVRNKVIAIALSVIKRDQPFTEHYLVATS
jgi:transposase